MKLTDREVKAFEPKEKQYKKSDGKGLYLLIHPNGSKYWRFKYKFNDKEKTLAIGVYPECSLAKAREEAGLARQKLNSGIDPSFEKKIINLKSKYSIDDSFESIAKEWHENQKEAWTQKHSKVVLKRLERELFPLIGKKRISDVKTPELLLLLRAIESRGTIDLAKRVKQTCSQVFKYAIALGKAESDITTNLQGALKSQKRKHLSYLAENELPEFLKALSDFNGDRQTQIGLYLIILTFVRTNELRAAKWKEFDFENSIWKIPGERMKMREPHIVPLSKQAIDLFLELHSLNSYSQYIFPSRSNSQKHISENTLLYAVYRLGYHNRTTVHGFRSTASTILNEKGFKPDVIERQLAHCERNSVRASYNHAQYLEERKEMMQWWADYIYTITKHL